MTRRLRLTVRKQCPLLTPSTNASAATHSQTDGFVLDEAYQGRGIVSFMYQVLARLARERGIIAMAADVLVSNPNTAIHPSNRWVRHNNGLHHWIVFPLPGHKAICFSRPAPFLISDNPILHSPA
ncbi:MAG: GNAT family N-acetyltransferase [Bacteroidetes bacterium]|nr:GNAT family N-acetyltransferase [Bacteroidota bacterium]